MGVRAPKAKSGIRAKLITTSLRLERSSMSWKRFTFPRKKIFAEVRHKYPRSAYWLIEPSLVTATHLKRLFASQETNPSDRIVSGQSVAAIDEEETKSQVDEKARSECSAAELKETPDQPLPSVEEDLSEVPQLVLDTPMPRRNPMESAVIGEAAPAPDPSREAQSEENGPERLYDSDSTISALPFINKTGCHGQRHYVGGESSASGMDADVRILPSRLPRRSKPTPT